MVVQLAAAVARTVGTKAAQKVATKAGVSKSTSQTLYNARRRAKRLVTKLENELANTKASTNSKNATRDYINTLNERISNSYTPKGYRTWSAQQKEEFLTSAEASLNKATAGMGGRGQSASIARQNKAFERQLNLARTEQPSILSNSNASLFRENAESKSLEYSRKEVEMFYQSTRRLWRGVDVSDRNAAIMKGLGTDTLEEAFELVKSMNSDYRARIAEEIGSGVTHTVENTAEQDAFNQELGFDSEQQGSPTDIVIVS